MGKLINKEKESSIYPGFLIWTELLVNQNLDKRKCFFTERVQLSWKGNHEIRISPFGNPSELTHLGTEHEQLLISQKEESATNYVPPDISPIALPKELNLNLNKPLNSCEGNSENRRKLNHTIIQSAKPGLWKTLQ